MDDAQCPAFHACSNGCIPIGGGGSCAEGAACPEGWTCGANSRCRPANAGACGTCPSVWVCAGAECGPPVASRCAGDCGPGSVCDHYVGECRVGAACAPGSPCGTRHFCESGVCVPVSRACERDSDCWLSQRCDGAGACVDFP